MVITPETNAFFLIISPVGEPFYAIVVSTRTRRVFSSVEFLTPTRKIMCLIQDIKEKLFKKVIYS